MSKLTSIDLEHVRGGITGNTDQSCIPPFPRPRPSPFPNPFPKPFPDPSPFPFPRPGPCPFPGPTIPLGPFNPNSGARSDA
jgi:hypothetical protein